MLIASGALAVLLAAAAAVVLRVHDGALGGERPLVVAAWTSLRDDRAADSLRTGLRTGGLTEVSPTWVTVRADGGLVVTEPLPEAEAVLDAATGARVIPVVQNYADGAWQGEPVAELLADEYRAARHREQLVELAVQHGWDGLDIDYEQLPATAGPQLVAFLTALATDLHDRGMTLAVAVPARTADDDPVALAYSYALIGRVADQVRLMTYDHSWNTSPPGPVAPPEWIRSVVDYAVDQVPPDKLMLGLATYGYDWVGSTGTSLQAADAVALARRVGAEPRWDGDAAGTTFSYSEDGRQHTVWYENARSLAVKRDIAADAGLRGVAIWQLGGEDPQLWTTIRTATREGTR